MDVVLTGLIERAIRDLRVGKQNTILADLLKRALEQRKNGPSAEDMTEVRRVRKQPLASMKSKKKED